MTKIDHSKLNEALNFSWLFENNTSKCSSLPSIKNKIFQFQKDATTSIKNKFTSSYFSIISLVQTIQKIPSVLNRSLNPPKTPSAPSNLKPEMPVKKPANEILTPSLEDVTTLFEENPEKFQNVMTEKFKSLNPEEKLNLMRTINNLRYNLNINGKSVTELDKIIHLLIEELQRK